MNFCLNRTDRYRLVCTFYIIFKMWNELGSDYGQVNNSRSPISDGSHTGGRGTDGNDDGGFSDADNHYGTGFGELDRLQSFENISNKDGEETQLLKVREDIIEDESSGFQFSTLHGLFLVFVLFNIDRD